MIISYITYITSHFGYTTSHALQKQVRRLYFVVANFTWLLGLQGKSIATYETIKHIDLDSYLTRSGCLLKKLQVVSSLGQISSFNHNPRADFNKPARAHQVQNLSQLKWRNRHPTSCFAYPKYVFANRSRVSVRVKLARAAKPQYRRDPNCNERETHKINNVGDLYLL